LKKKVVFVLFLGFFIIINKNCFAQIYVINNLNVSTEMSNIHYKEPGVMKQSGSMTGLEIAYTHYNSYVFRLEGRTSFGQVDYQSVDTGSMNDVDDHMFEARSWIGYDLCPTINAMVIPYVGAGYRYLKDDSQGRTTTTGALGYERESNYYYSPIGVEATTEIKDGLFIGMVMEFDYFWKGVQKSYFSGAVTGASDLENDQNNGYGYRASLKVAKQTLDFDLVIEPFIRYWKIKVSEEDVGTIPGIVVDGDFVEPKNYSTEYGMKISLAF